MSRRAPVVEEFDDDTDLPLPSRPLYNTGERGPLLEAVDDDDDSDNEDIDDDDDDDDEGTDDDDDEDTDEDDEEDNDGAIETN